MFSIGLSLTGRLKSSFSPISLFATGSQGFWLEPSDLTTMFTDRAGATPVTTPGQTVGLRLDKSKGLTLGSELVTNGDFSGGTTSWTAGGGASLSVVSGNLRVSYSAGAAYPSANQTISGLVSGRTYEITVVANTGSGTHLVGLNCSQFNPTVNTTIFTSTTTSTYKTRVVATGTTSTTQIFANTGSTTISGFITVVSFSVKELPGNHAVAPTDAARPTYGIEPKTGRRNLLTRTEEFGDAVWLKSSGTTATENQSVAPNGTTTADLVTSGGAAGYIFPPTSLFAAAAGATYTYSAYAKAGTATTISLLIAATATYSGTFNLSTGVASAGSANTTASMTDVGNGWYRCVLTCAAVANTAYTEAQIGRVALGLTFSLWGAQLELGSTATAYQRVGTAFDVTEAGVATVHYVQYDGTDDSFSTSSIDFSATDKMSVFAGVRKLSDAALGMAAELSVDASANSGSFRLIMPGSAGYEYRQRGSLNAAGAGVGSGFAAPITNVITGLGDISGDTTTLRINGTQVAQSTADQGTGNFGNYPLFIGRRWNTSLPFNGRDYGIIVVGKTASASEIYSTESYLAANTSGVSI